MFEIHGERAKYSGIYVSEDGISLPFEAYGLVRVNCSEETRRAAFEETCVHFQCQLLTESEHASLDEHGDDMSRRIIGTFANLLSTHEPTGFRSDFGDSSRLDATPHAHRLWSAIDEYLGRERHVRE